MTRHLAPLQLLVLVDTLIGSVLVPLRLLFLVDSLNDTPLESLDRPLPVLTQALETVRLLTNVVVLEAGVVTLFSARALATEIDRLLTITVVVVDDVGRARLLTLVALVTPQPKRPKRGSSSLSPGLYVGTGVPRLDPFPHLDLDSGNARLSLQVSKAISRFARYPDKRPVGLSSAADGSLDIHQVWLHWGRRTNLSRHQLLQYMTEHAFGPGGHRRFLLRSDSNGRTWVTAAEPFLDATNDVVLAPRSLEGECPCPTSLDPGCVSVVSVSLRMVATVTPLKTIWVVLPFAH